MNEIQDITNLEIAVRDIMGLQEFMPLQTTQLVSQKVSILVDFLVDNYSFFFQQEDVMEELASDLDILTDIQDDEYELTDEIVDSIMGINSLIEDDEDMLIEIQQEMKTILIYLLEILQEV